MRRPAKYLSERLQVLQKLWLEVGETFPGVAFLQASGQSEARALAKYASVSGIGQWGCKEQFRFKLETTSCEEDCMASSASVSANYAGQSCIAKWESRFQRLYYKAEGP